MSPYWKGRLVEFFALGLPSYRVRFRIPYHRKTVERWFRILRIVIYQQTLKELKPLSGEIEMDETMFVAGGLVSVVGELQGNTWSSIRGMVRF